MAILKYPFDLAEGNGDWVLFEFYNYKSPYSKETVNANIARENESKFIEVYNKQLEVIRGESNAAYDKIALYMPEDISASYAGKWGGRDFGPLAPIGLNAAGSMMGGDVMKVGQAALSEAKRSLGGVMPYIGASLISSAMNGVPGFGGSVTANDVLASTRGEILNPNTEVLYQGPDLRTLNLTFKMMARNKNESESIRSICNTFKKASLPSGSSAGKNLINVPKVVKISFKHKTEDNPYISQFKMCAIGGVQVNYTPNGTWSTYANGDPVAVNLALQFQELKLLYEDEISKGY